MAEEEYTRVPTGVPGLDELIEGGIPSGTVNLICGPAGSAKSMLGMHFITHGAKLGEVGLYVTLEESKESLFRSAKRINIDLSALEDQGLLFVMDLTTIRQHSSNEEEGSIDLLKFHTLQRLIDQHLAQSGAKRMCVDSVTCNAAAKGSTNTASSSLTLSGTTCIFRSESAR